MEGDCVIPKLEHCAGRTVEMIYIDRRGSVTRRTVAIRRVAGDVVQAYCFSRKAPRSFKRDNILAIVPANGRRTG